MTKKEQMITRALLALLALSGLLAMLRPFTQATEVDAYEVSSEIKVLSHRPELFAEALDPEMASGLLSVWMNGHMDPAMRRQMQDNLDALLYAISHPEPPEVARELEDGRDYYKRYPAIELELGFEALWQLDQDKLSNNVLAAELKLDQYRVEYSQVTYRVYRVYVDYLKHRQRMIHQERTVSPLLDQMKRVRVMVDG